MIGRLDPPFGGMRDAASLHAVIQRHPLLVAVGLVMLLRIGFVVYAGHALDDLKYMDTLPPKDLLLAQGRFGWLLLERFLALFGLVGPYWMVHGTLLGCAALTWTALRGQQAMTRESDLASTGVAVAAASLFTLHPFVSEIISFREAFPFFASAMLLGGTAFCVWATRTGWIWWLLGVGTLVLAVSINQLAVNLVAVLALLMMVYGLTMPRVPLALARRVVAGIIVAVGVYSALLLVVVAITGVELDSRAKSLSLNFVAERLGEVLSTYQQLVLMQLPTRLNAVSVLLGMLAALGALRLVSSVPSLGRKAMVILLLALTPLAAIGVVAVGGVYWPAPRTLIAFALVSAILVAEGARAVSRISPALGLVIVGLILASFTVSSNMTAWDQQRVNQRDRLTAVLINERLSALGTSQVAFVGRWQHGLNVRTRHGDLSLSAFAVEWSRGPALVEYTGRPWTVWSDVSKAEWDERCSDAARWPDAGSWFVDGEVGVICL